MNDKINHTISQSLKCLEQGAFQTFCQKFFKIYCNIDFKPRGATSYGNTRAGTPDYLYVGDKQICLQVSIDKDYWKKKWEKSKPKNDIDLCINKITDISKIILCSNQDIPTNNTDVEKRIVNYAKEKNIAVECFALCDFVKIISNNLLKYSEIIKNPYFANEDIEYLRKYYKTKDDYINWCKCNLELYKNFINYNEKLNIKRNNEEIFYSYIEESNGLIYLVSPSGNGKSNLCYNSAKKYIDNNKFAIWIKSNMVESSDNYEHWIIDALEEADVNFKEEYFAYFKELYTRDGLLLIIDDINSIINKNLKNKLSYISSAITKNKSNVRIICPVWSIGKEDYENEKFKVFSIGNYDIIEAENALNNILNLKNIELPKHKKKEITELLNNDPYLIGLTEELSSDEIMQLANKTVNQICNSFIDTICEDIANTNNSNFLVLDYKNALYSLIYDELKNNRQNTNFSEINEIDKIRPILKNEKICKLDKENNVIFRHDRLKSFLQIQALLNQQQVSDSILSNPYYNKILGEYIAYANLSVDTIKYIQKNNPIAILNTINYIDFYNDNLSEFVLETFKDIFIDKIFDIFKDSEIKNIGSYSNNIEYYANQVLANITNEQFLSKIKHEYKDEIKKINSDGLYLLQLKYGDLIVGLKYYHWWLNGTGELYIDDYNFNKCLLEIKAKFSKEEINNACKKLIESLDMPYKKTAIIISALLETTDINDSIENIWKTLNKDEMVAYCIFALLKCYNSKSEKLLNILIDYWLSMNNENADDNSCPPRSSTYGLLTRAINELSDDAIDFLINYAKFDRENGLYIFGLLQHIDNPKVYDYKVKYYSDNPQLMLSLFDKNKINNPETLIKIKSIWTNKDENHKYRYKALNMYAPYITNDDLVDLKELETLKVYQDNIYTLSCQLRARLNDKTVTKNLCELIKQENKIIDVCLMEFQHIWNKSLIPFIVNLFNNYKDKVNVACALSELLIRIDKNDAENIALECFKNYKEYSYFQESLIIIGTPKLIDLLYKYLNEKNIKLDIKFHLLNTKFDSDKKSIEINNQILRRIADFAPYIDSESLAYIVIKTKNISIENNTYDKILKHISQQDIYKYNLCKKDDIFYEQKLDEIYNQKNMINSFWCLGLDYNKNYSHISNTEKQTLINILFKWFHKYNDIRAFNICSEIVGMIGERKNLYVIKNLISSFVDLDDITIAKKILFNTKYLIEVESLI